ncbi:MAG: hypothetical protein IJO43_03405 [Bacilli bacterium]|nr:hypothetical protein [Bacilli bacterium]
MKMKNNRGLVLPELMAIIAFIAIIFGVVAYISFQKGDKRKFEVFAQNARDFATKVSTYRDEYSRYDNEVYLEDIVEVNHIKPYVNPFSGGGNCNLYESKITIKTNGERYVTFRCGNYLIDSQLVSSNNYRVYKVSEWKEKIDNLEEAQSVKLYNYEKDGEVVLDSYVVLKELITVYNEKENANIKKIDDIDLEKYNVITKTFYRTKKLVGENL